jgi:predicted metalloendopeptidase
MKDYYNIINDSFLKNIQLKDDESFANITSFRYKKDKKLIDDIINKSSYKYLTEKEIRILKTFNQSVRNYDENINTQYLKDKISNIFNLSYEELFAFCIKNKVGGSFDIDVLLYNGNKFLYFSQGKNNISNKKLYDDKNFRIKYKIIIKDMLKDFIDVNDDIVDKIYQFEYSIQSKKLSNTERRDVSSVFNKYLISDIKFKNFNFNKLINELLNKDTDSTTTIYIDTVLPNEYYLAIDDSIPNPYFKYYIIWSIILEFSYASFGSLYNKLFELIKIIKGIKKKMNHEKKIYMLNNQFIGNLISKEYFINIDPTVKDQIKQYIVYTKKSFRERLINNTWMDKITKETAIKKLDKIKEDIYQSELIDFNQISELSNIYYENIHILNDFLFKKKLDELYMNHRYFYGNIYNINAFYETTRNEIIFPYGILQPPYYYNTDINNINNLENIAYNFGAIGSVIGHEIIHGFDDQGRLFDENGYLKNWWQPESEKKYVELNEKIGKLYEAHNINSKLTMGENIADIGGVRISLSAFKILLKEKGKKLDDKLLTNFLKGWAMVWRGKSRKEELEIRLLNDPHSPTKQRVNIPLNNLIETYELDTKRVDKIGNQIIENKIIDIW